MEEQSKQPAGDSVPVEKTEGAGANATGGANAEQSVDPTVFERAVDTAAGQVGLQGKDFFDEGLAIGAGSDAQIDFGGSVGGDNVGSLPPGDDADVDAQAPVEIGQSVQRLNLVG